jgi:DNA-binding NtrC family response regulator
MLDTNKKYNILFVDDEKRILTALRSIFRREYNVFIANGGEEALTVLANNSIDVIVSDQRMPNMLGNELLAQVHKLYPKTMRLLLTGFMDKEAIIRTINEGEIYRFINKPWSNDEIHKTIAEAALASEFEIDSTPTEITADAFAHPAKSESIGDKHTEQSILMMGDNQALRNQIRHLCRQHSINIYGSTSIPQAIGVVAARPTIGVSIIELPVNIDDAMHTISLLKEKRPDLISIVLTDETDADVAVELINSGQVFRYLAKPLETAALERAIGQAFIRHNALKSNSDAQKRFTVKQSSRTLAASLKDLFSSFNLSGKNA